MKYHHKRVIIGILALLTFISLASIVLGQNIDFDFGSKAMTDLTLAELALVYLPLCLFTCGFSGIIVVTVAVLISATIYIVGAIKTYLTRRV